MAHKQVLFRSAAREKILRGATQLADAVRVTLGPRSKSVLIEKKWGAPIVCNDGVTIAKEFDLKDPEENLGAQMLRQAAEKTGDDGRRRHQHLDHSGACDLRRRRAQRRRRRQRDRHQARPRSCAPSAAIEALRAMSRPVDDAQGKGAGRDDLGAQRSGDRRARRRRDGEGRRRGRDHGRGIEDHRDDRSRWSRACSSIAAFISPYFITNPEKMEAVLEDALILICRSQDQRRSRTCCRCSSRSPRPAAPLLVVAEDVEGEALATLIVNQIPRRAEELRRQGAGLRRPAQGDAAGHRRADRRPGDLARNSASSSRT